MPLITISLPWEYHKVPQGILREMTHEVLEFYFHLYKKEQISAYAEIHYPKQQTSVDSKTGERKQRLPHVHLIVSKLNLWTGNQLRILPYKKEVAQAFQILLDDNHGFKTHYYQNKEDKLVLPSPDESDMIVEEYKHWHRQNTPIEMRKQKYAPKNFLVRPEWLLDNKQDEKHKNTRRAASADQALQNWKMHNQETNDDFSFSAVHALKQRLIDMQMLIEYKLLIEYFNKEVNLATVLAEAENQFGLNRDVFEISKFKKGVTVLLDKRTNHTYSAMGMAYEYLHMSVIQSLKWLKRMAPELEVEDDLIIEEEELGLQM